MESDGHRLTIRNGRVAYLITFSYDVPWRQLVGGPEWATTDRYDVVAVASEKADAQEVKSMRRRLLGERFGLGFHREKRRLPAYELLVDKGGPKMETSASDTHGSGFQGRGMGQLTVTNGRMPGFAKWLNSVILDRPVI
jgi:uncharacterized protein (TIGR03435 family)